MREYPSGGDLVIRGTGSNGMRASHLIERIRRDREWLGFNGLSVHSGAALSLRQLCDAADLKHKFIQQTEASQLLDLGLEFVDRGSGTHWSIKFSEDSYDDQVRSFVDSFEPPQKVRTAL